MKIIHMHAEHFEPFDTDQSGERISVKHVETWIKAALEAPFTPSIFFSSQGIPLQNKKVISEEAEIIALLKDAGMDLHIHIHHPVDGLGDERLLKAVLQETKDRGFVSHNDKWAFVHGCWALQGSDRSICQIDNELSVLYQYGCRADMTFPPGRAWCRPDRVLAPYFAIPAAGPKAYDRPESDPILLSGLPPWEHEGRILIWNTAISMDKMSFDILATNSIEPNSLCETWLNTCPDIEGTIYIKTHSHPLNPVYWPNSAKTVGPVANQQIHMLIDGLKRRCECFNSIPVSSVLR